VTDGPLAHALLAWTDYEPIPGGVRLRCLTTGGAEAEVRLTCPLAGVLRLQAAPGPVQTQPSPILAPQDREPAAVQVEMDEEELTLSTPDLCAHVGRRPWRLWVEDATGAELFAEQLPALARGTQAASALGWRRRPGGRLAVRESYALTRNEALFGLGEQPGGLNRRGQAFRCTLQPAAGHGRAVPLVWSTRGYGLLVHSHSPVLFDLGSRSPTLATVMVDDAQLDLFLLLGPAPADILRRYAHLCGTAPLPPAWALGFSIVTRAGRRGPASRQSVEEVCASLRAQLIPCDAVHLPVGPGNSALDLDAAGRHELAELVGELHRAGFRVSVAAGPYACQGSEFFAEGVERGYFVRDGQGRPLIRRRKRAQRALVDLTLPAARVWWQGRLRELFATGVDALLADDGIDVPRDGVYHDGTPGRQMHRRYPLLCQDALREVAGDRVVWAPSVWAGSQRLVVPWSPAGLSTPGHLADRLRAGLSLGLSGIPFWLQEVGGEGEHVRTGHFVRACQVAFLSSFARLCAGPAELAALGREVEEAVRTYAGLRHCLAPYIYAAAVTSAQSGLPLMRALVLSYPDDHNTWSLGGEYLLGEDLLVAPAWEAPAEVAVYVPSGCWIDYWTDEIHHGPAWVRCRVPLERLPLLVRGGAIIPTQPPAHNVSERPEGPLVLQAYPQASGHSVLYTADGTHELTLEATSNRLELHVPPLGLPVETILHGVPPPRAVTLDGQEVDCHWTAGRARISLGQGGLLTYEANYLRAAFPEPGQGM
jgi:alpha-D-xyloside xylohydrolase